MGTKKKMHGGRTVPIGIGLAAMLLFVNCSSSQGKRSVNPAENLLRFENQPDVSEENRLFIAHEFFLRARQQELEGHDPIALSFYQIAFDYDAKSRDLCFVLVDKLKSAEKIDSALTAGLKCLNLEGTATSWEYQLIAEAYLRKGDVSKALTYYHQALELNEGDKDLLYTLATLYESLKDIQKQVAITEKLLPRIDFPLRLVEKQVLNFKLMGKLEAVKDLYLTAWDRTTNPLFGEKLVSFYEEQELYQNLLMALQRLNRENPDNIHYELQKARAFILVNMADSAFAAYETLLRKSPEEKEFLSPYASLLFEKGRYKEAKAYFERLLVSQPANPVYHFLLGSIGAELKDRELAESELQKALELDNKAPEYWARLAFFYVQDNREQLAFDLMGKMAAVHEKSWHSWYVHGIVSTQVAKKLESEAKTLTPKPAAENLHKAVKMREQGMDLYQKALVLDPKNSRVLFEVGISYEKLGKKREAIDTLRKLVKIDSGDAVILNYLGYMLVEENQELDYAGHLIDRALKLDTNNGAYLDSKGWWYYRRNEFGEARRYIERALNQVPEDTTILEHYALILEKLGESRKALENWKRILKIDPAHDLAQKRVN